MKFQRYQDLQYLSQIQQGARVATVLFHGYGADASDLYSLGQVLRVEQAMDWYFPQGFLEVPIGPMMSGRAWFELRASDFDRYAKGQYEDRGISSQQEECIKKVCLWMNHLGSSYDKVFIGGFSQGAILTSHCFHRLEFVPGGLAFLSGVLLAASAIPILPKNFKGLSYFQSHGKGDQVLPINGAHKLYNKLQELGLKGEWHEFHGGHEIPLEIISRLQNFLNASSNLEANPV